MLPLIKLQLSKVTVIRVFLFIVGAFVLTGTILTIFNINRKTNLTPDAQTEGLNFGMSFSTYIGGSNWEHARDVFQDSVGNIYIVGGTESADYPVTLPLIGAGGSVDVFVSKFSSGGNLIWSRRIGGGNYDRAYAIEGDNQGNIVVAGRAGPGFPVTQGSFQTTFRGGDNGIYGMQNAFVMKLNTNGQLIWASYAGNTFRARDVAIDSSGDIYLPIGNETANPNPSSWYINAFQKVPNAKEDSGVLKVKSDGTAVLWGTYFGGSEIDSGQASIRVDQGKNVYILFVTQSTDLPTTIGNNQKNGGFDAYIAKFSPDGSQLLMGRYLGGSDNDGFETHSLAIDSQGNSYLFLYTKSADFPTTLGAYDRNHSGTNFVDWSVAKISPSGQLIHSTFIGGSGGENPDGIYVDSLQNVYLSGETASTDFPVVNPLNVPQINYSGSYNHGQSDAVAAVLSSDFSQLLFSSYIGGPASDNGRASFLANDGSFLLTGSSAGAGWPLINAYQNSFNGGSMPQFGAGDNILVKLTPQSAGLPSPTPSLLPQVTPTPTSTGTSTVPPNVDIERIDVKFRIQGVTLVDAGSDFSFEFIQDGVVKFSKVINLASGMNGIYSISILNTEANLESGYYDLRIKSNSHLARRYIGIKLDQSITNLDFSAEERYMLRSGDVNGDNKITVEDIAQISVYYTDFSVAVDNTIQTMSACDTNKDGFITISDFALVAINWSDFIVNGE